MCSEAMGEMRLMEDTKVMEDMGFVEAEKVLFGIYSMGLHCTALPGEITVMVGGKAT
jgi:hypothetical protein